MYKTLLLFFALLILGGMQPSLAGRPTAYARAKMHGRRYTHRPNYKVYRGFRNHRTLHLFKAKSHSRSTKPAARRSAHTSRF